MKSIVSRRWLVGLFALCLAALGLAVGFSSSAQADYHNAASGLSWTPSDGMPTWYSTGSPNAWVDRTVTIKNTSGSSKSITDIHLSNDPNGQWTFVSGDTPGTLAANATRNIVVEFVEAGFHRVQIATLNVTMGGVLYTQQLAGLEESDHGVNGELSLDDMMGAASNGAINVTDPSPETVSVNVSYPMNGVDFFQLQKWNSSLPVHYTPIDQMLGGNSGTVAELFFETGFSTTGCALGPHTAIDYRGSGSNFHNVEFGGSGSDFGSSLSNTKFSLVLWHHDVEAGGTTDHWIQSECNDTSAKTEFFHRWVAYPDPTQAHAYWIACDIAGGSTGDWNDFVFHIDNVFIP